MRDGSRWKADVKRLLITWVVATALASTVCAAAPGVRRGASKVLGTGSAPAAVSATAATAHPVVASSRSRRAGYAAAAVAAAKTPRSQSATIRTALKPVTRRVTGGITSAPALVPTSVEPTRFEGTGVCPEQWYGTWTGESTCVATSARVDPATGDLVATLVDVFEGVSMIDHSHGTLTIDERVSGNLLEGSALLDGVIVDGTGAFACSSGHITMDLYLSPVASYGGYDGTWTNGVCPVTRPAPTMPPLPQVAGGILSIPTAVPTGGDPSTFTFTGTCPEEWTGELTGVSTCDIPFAHGDPSTGDLTAKVVETLHATDMRDHSTGTLVIDETITGNVFLGEAFIDGTVTSATGDHTFRCMLGSHFSMPFFLNAAGSFGGYVLDRSRRCA